MQNIININLNFIKKKNTQHYSKNSSLYLFLANTS